MCSILDLEHTDLQAAGVQAGTTSFVSFKRNNVSPMARPMGQALPRGTLLSQRVKDAGESERRSVMERINARSRVVEQEMEELIVTRYEFDSPARAFPSPLFSSCTLDRFNSSAITFSSGSTI